MGQPISDKTLGLRQIIEGFLTERLAEKLKAKKLSPTDEDGEKLRVQYEPENWIRGAARRVGQIRAVTHIAKATHPDSKGSSLFFTPASFRATVLVSSHCLKNGFVNDVVGNAAALDVYKFLKLEYQGRSILSWAQEQSEFLLSAFSDNREEAMEWCKAFGRLTAPQEAPCSDTLAKQVYWLTGDDPTQDDQFHLLAPLYASSLAHQVFEVISEHRFGEVAKGARDARKKGEYSSSPIHEYPDLAIQKLGGTKPQNISQLNSERHGENYLLASLPPIWKSRRVNPPLGSLPLFEQFGRLPVVQTIIMELRAFLESDPPSNAKTRDRRDNLLEAIVSELYQFADEIQLLPAGWSKGQRCSLAESEKLWLDPGRRNSDADFAQKRQEVEVWGKDVRHRFANWLNRTLGHRLPLGDLEHAFWMDTLGDESWSRHVASQEQSTPQGEVNHV